MNIENASVGTSVLSDETTQKPRGNPPALVGVTNLKYLLRNNIEDNHNYVYVHYHFVINLLA